MNHSILEQIGVIAIAVSIVVSIAGAIWRAITITELEEALKQTNTNIKLLNQNIIYIEQRLIKLEGK
jgi:hypothetical protein